MIINVCCPSNSQALVNSLTWIALWGVINHTLCTEVPHWKIEEASSGNLLQSDVIPILPSHWVAVSELPHDPSAIQSSALHHCVLCESFQ